MEGNCVLSDGEVAENVAAVRAEIAEACAEAGRDPSSVRLVAVSKFHPAGAVLAAMGAGQLLFGENRVQEAASKFASLPESAELHMIGSLQRNKVRAALSIRQLSAIESVDRLPLLEEIERACASLGRNVDVLLEIHAGEESKAGFRSEDDVRSALSALACGSFPHVRVRGLMAMAPNVVDRAAVRAAFGSVRRLRDRMAAEFPSLPLGELSMGMSGDFREGIAEGATVVRVGTAIFGRRA